MAINKPEENATRTRKMRATSPSGWAGWDRLGATPSPTAGRILGEDPTVCKTCHRQVHAHRSAPRAPAQNSNMKRRAGNTEPQPKHQIPKLNHCACQYPYFRCRHSHVCRLRQQKIPDPCRVRLHRVPTVNVVLASSRRPLTP